MDRSIGALLLLIITMANTTSGNARLLEAVAFQNEGTREANVLNGISELDGVWSPSDIVPQGTVTEDWFGTGLGQEWLDAVSFVFEGDGLDKRNLTLRAYMQKGDYEFPAYQYYQLLPGRFNPHNQDANYNNVVEDLPPDVLNHSATVLDADTTVGWVDFNFNPATEPDYLLPNGDVAVTLRLFVWRIDAVELVAGPQPGDTDADGDVDIADLNNVRNHFGEGVILGPPAPGEAFPFNGLVDVGDLNLVRNAFGASRPTAVPEPPSDFLCVVAFALVSLRCRFKSR